MQSLSFLAFKKLGMNSGRGFPAEYLVTFDFLSSKLDTFSARDLFAKSHATFPNMVQCYSLLVFQGLHVIIVIRQCSLRRAPATRCFRSPLYGRILCRFWNKARYWSKNANLSYIYFLPCNLQPPRSLLIFFQNFNTICPSYWDDADFCRKVELSE